MFLVAYFVTDVHIPLLLLVLKIVNYLLCSKLSEGIRSYKLDYLHDLDISAECNDILKKCE